MPHENVPKTAYQESLEDGLQIFHNPNAKYPLDPALFRADGVVQHYFDDAKEDWVYEGIAGALTWRFVKGHLPSNPA
jgi:hypothetical protein